MSMIHRFAAALTLVVIGLCTTACPSSVHTNVSPVADVANAGGKIEDTGQAIFKATIDARAATPQVVSQAAADAVAIAVNRLGHAGLTLNAALTTYNTAKAAGGDLTAQRAAVAQALGVVQQFLTEVGRALPPGTLKTVDNLVALIFTIVGQVKGAVGL